MKVWRNLLLLFPILIILSGCGNSDGTSTTTSSTTGTVSALDIPDKVSVVDAQSSSTSSSVSPLYVAKAIDPSALSSDSDYHKDKTFYFVEERSAETFDLINEILCSIAQSKYDDMLNKGTYKAQIDTNQCSSAKDSASSGGQGSKNQSSGSTRPQYEMWVVESSRASNSDPHIVKVWIHEEAENGEPEKIIFAKMTITEGVSTSNPYGIFTINFKSHPVNSGVVDTSQTLFKGFLKTEQDSSGKVLLKFTIEGNFSTPGGNVSFAEQAVLDRPIGTSSGEGYVKSQSQDSSGSISTAFNILYDNSYFYRTGTVNSTQVTVCLDRNNFHQTAWRYGLYDSTGKRVTRNSGFPIRYNDGSKNYYGWIGYWGLWFPEDATLTSGATVYRQSFSSGTETPYTVFISGGKLIKHEKKTLTLDKIKNIPLQWYDNSTSTDYRVVWDDTGFKKVETLDTQDWLWKKITTTSYIDLSSLSWTDLHFWSQSLGGSVQVRLNGNDPENNPLCSESGGTFDCSSALSDPTLIPVVFFAENMVYPSDLSGDLTLYCFENCPDPSNITQTNPYFDTSTYQYQNTAPSSANKIQYTFNKANMVLRYGTSDVVLTGSNSAFQWGVWSGPLVPSDQLNSLACDWDTSGNSTCAWQAWSNLTVFYTWETGTNSWNKFTALKDSSDNFLTFDPPLLVEYTHSQTDANKPDNKYNGVKFYLEYSGFGELHGIPGVCVDIDSGKPENCDETSRWVPEFMIPAGSNMVDASDSTVEYIAKPLEIEQRMLPANTSDPTDITACQNAGLTSPTLGDSDLPDINAWVDPNIGDMPTVTSAPAVIGGVVQ